MSASFAGAIFDVDGVLVDSPHEAAWREALDELMVGEWRGLVPGWRPGALTPDVYRRLVSGKPRLAGARAALAELGVPDPDARAPRYGERKQARLLELVEAGALHGYADAARLVAALREAGVPTAAASSSANAPLLLARVGLVLDADVSGRVDGPGKPHPGIFVAAARALGAPPARCLVVEDAVAGVQAGRAAGMAVLGIARADDAAQLAAAGAHLVVADLDDVDVAAVRAGRLARRDGLTARAETG